MLLRSIAIVDVNFDGHPDVTVLREFGAKWGALDAIVFDPHTQRFTTATPIARAIARLANATFDEQHKTITTRDVGPTNPERVTYAVDHDRLRAVSVVPLPQRVRPARRHARPHDRRPHDLRERAPGPIRRGPVRLTVRHACFSASRLESPESRASLRFT